MQCLHKRMIEEEYLVRTTIAYGHFRYENRLEIPRIRKDMIIGGAYLKAYAENDKKLPGSIVIVDAPDNFDVQISCGHLGQLFRHTGDSEAWEFFWWVTTNRSVENAKHKRDEACQSLYKALVKAYRKRSS